MSVSDRQAEAVAPGPAIPRGARLGDAVASVGRLGWPERLGLAGLAALTLVALAAPWLAPHDAAAQVAAPFQAPSAPHPLGTDGIGRDLLSRVLLGIRLTWGPAVGIIAIGGVVGTLVGLVAGASGGWVDVVLQRVTDLFLVLPSTLIALAVVAALGPGLGNTVIAISIFWWPWYARIVRGEVRALRARPHYEAAVLGGTGRLRRLTRYLLPGALPSLAVTATLDVANVVLVLSLFSFLGLGAPAPAPELGAMTAQSLGSLTTAWWLPVFPALVVFVLALSANLAGDGLRDLLRDR